MMTFEQAYRRLNEISKMMESSDIPLEDAVALYSEAADLVATCSKNIEKAKLEIEKIDNKD